MVVLPVLYHLFRGFIVIVSHADDSVEVGARKQRYHEDCEVCCRPMKIEIRFDENYDFDLQVQRSSGH